MYDISNIPDYEQFKYWFVKNADTWTVVDRCTNTECGMIDDQTDPDVLSDFENFRLRPEFIVGSKIDTSDIALLQDKFERLILGIQLVRLRSDYIEAKQTPEGLDLDAYIPKFMRCITWLRTTDFYQAPASTQYHDSYSGGLLVHTATVYNEILDVIMLPKFASIRFDRACLVSLVHDWCKIGLYEVYTRNVKNEQTGQWEKVEAFRHNQKGIPLGHGTASMFLASRFFVLTTDEAIAIRWHMGEYNVADNEMNELHLANEKTPLAFAIQFADRLSITSY